MTPRRRPYPARRGFTMMELALAALLGGLIMVASLGVFNALDRADRTLKARFDQTAQLNNLHLIMRRTFVSMAMSAKPMPRPRAGGTSTPPPGPPSGSSANTSGASGAAAKNAGSGASQGGGSNTANGGEGTSGEKSGESGAGAGAASDAEPPPEPARVILAEDRRVSDTVMMRLDTGGVNSGSLSSPPVWKPQRLEVVLSRSPVPLPRVREGRQLGAFPESSSGRDEFTSEEVTGSKLFRGIFELKPVPPGTPGPGGSPARSVLTWALWLRPMPPGTIENAGRQGSVREYDLGPPSLIASDLTYLRWQFYDDRVRKTEFSTAYVNSLPAYVEMEVQTASGLWENWMFEVDFVMSSEESGDAPAGGEKGASGGAKFIRSPKGSGGNTQNRTPGGKTPGAGK